jgi:NAD(P)-dependent dehydrogenase (short-subunit alcohol dehydrogenase family)
MNSNQEHWGIFVELNGRVAILTGCTGLGQRIGQMLAGEGAQVAGVYLRLKVRAEALAEEWSAVPHSRLI